VLTVNDSTAEPFAASRWLALVGDAALQVDGDHRVGIFAKKDIAPYSELYYDYNYENDKVVIACTLEWRCREFLSCLCVAPARGKGAQFG
jgi:hypothetical protein